MPKKEIVTRGEAIALIVREAGGKVSDYQGVEHEMLDGQNIVASNGLIHAEMLATLEEIHRAGG